MYYNLSESDVQLENSELWSWLDLESGKRVTHPAFIKMWEDRGIIAPEAIKTRAQSILDSASYLIYDFTDNKSNPTLLPKSLIFPQQLNRNLQKTCKLSYGNRVNSTFFSDYDPGTKKLINPVVKIDYVYFRDDQYLIDYIERTFSWMLKSGQWSRETYKDIKVFSNLSQKYKELKKVRENILEESQALAAAFGLLPQMRLLYVRFESEVNLYSKAGSLALSEAVASAKGEEFDWLNLPTSDGSMRIGQFLSYFFSIGAIK